MNVVVVRSLSDEAFRPFGMVLRPEGRLDAVADSAEELVKRAPEILGGSIEQSRRTLVAAEPVFDEVEVHPRSRQFTITIDGPWLVAVSEPNGQGGKDEWQLGRVTAFEVPPGQAIVIEAGVWHSSAIGLRDTRIIAAFLTGTISGGTDKVRLESPLRIVPAR